MELPWSEGEGEGESDSHHCYSTSFPAIVRLVAANYAEVTTARETGKLHLADKSLSCWENSQRGMVHCLGAASVPAGGWF